MSRLVVVSNRVAVAQRTRGDTGGLAVALRSALEQHGGLWFGWSGEVGQRARQRTTERPPITFVTVDLSRNDYEEYYNGFANRALWPLLHYRLDLANFERQAYSTYERVNAMFARRLVPLLKADDRIWIHDYHLIPLGAELRRAGVRNKIGFFLHTPFPAAEVLTVLPAHQDLVRDLCAYNLVGFQTEADLRAFREYVLFESDGEFFDGTLVRAFGRTVEAQAFPIGIDTEGTARLAQQSARSQIVRQLERYDNEYSWIIGVDRLDYSKGIEERFNAFEMLLEKYPAYHGHVRYLQISPPSRTGVPEYRAMREALEMKAGHINGRFGDLDWAPLNYLVRSYAQRSLLGLYRSARVGLVTPLRDGMNLVAKEFVASQNPLDPGALVLSRFAGAAHELDAAVTINPFDVAGTADGIATAIDMPLEERAERWQSMMEALQANTLQHWLESYLQALEDAPRQA